MYFFELLDRAFDACPGAAQLVQSQLRSFRQLLLELFVVHWFAQNGEFSWTLLNWKFPGNHFC
ncbi:MAG: hypothetical protein SGPRY_001149 [Prymnesium sp.]